MPQLTNCFFPKSKTRLCQNQTVIGMNHFWVRELRLLTKQIILNVWKNHYQVPCLLMIALSATILLQVLLLHHSSQFQKNWWSLTALQIPRPDPNRSYILLNMTSTWKPKTYHQFHYPQLAIKILFCHPHQRGRTRLIKKSVDYSKIMLPIMVFFFSYYIYEPS